MADKLELQKEILGELVAYSEKIITGTEAVIKELRESHKEDTDELLNLVIQGINWEIEVFNTCEPLINEDEIQIDKGKMAEAVVRLGKMIKEKDDIKIAACFDVDFLPFLKSMEYAALTISQ